MELGLIKYLWKLFFFARLAIAKLLAPNDMQTQETKGGWKLFEYKMEITNICIFH